MSVLRSRQTSGHFLPQGKVTPKIQAVDVDNKIRHYLRGTRPEPF